MSSHDVLLVASQAAQRLDFFDVVDQKVIGTIHDLTAQPHEMDVDSRRRRAYIAHSFRSGGYGDVSEKAHEVSVIDVDRMSVLSVIDTAPYCGPHDVAYDPTRNLVYCGVEMFEGRNGLIVIDPDVGEVIAAIPVPAPNTHWFDITPDGRFAYLQHKEHPSVSVVDLESRTFLCSIDFPGGTEEITVAPGGDYVYVVTPTLTLDSDVATGRLKATVSSEVTPSLVKIDVKTNQVVGKIALGGCLAAVRVSTAGVAAVTEWRFSGNETDGLEHAPGAIHYVDTNTMELLGSVDSDHIPLTTRFSPDGRTSFTANIKSGTVTIVDVHARTVTNTFEQVVGMPFGGTHGLSYVSASTDNL